jgi:hypothetical protein
VRQKRIYAHSGWRQLSDQRVVYLYSGGAIGPEGLVDGVDVELSGELQRLRLSLPTGEDQLREAARASMDLLSIAPYEVMAPLMGAVYLAPLREFLRPDTEPDLVPWIHGPSGAMKTEIASLGQSHFGDFPRLRPPSSFQATANALERTLFTAKDALILVDDYHPASDRREEERMASTAVRLMRSTGNLSGRARMRADTTLRPELPPRALPIVTGERIPSGHSTVARMFPVAVKKGAVDLRRLTTAQARRGLLPIAMAGYVQGLAKSYDRLTVELPERFRAFRDRAIASKSGGHAREPGQIAHLYLGLDAMVRHMLDIGVITREEALHIRHHGWFSLVRLAGEHASEIHYESPDEMFLELIRDGLAASRIYLETTEGKEPDNARAWGWEAGINSEGLTMFQRPGAANVSGGLVIDSSI